MRFLLLKNFYQHHHLNLPLSSPNYTLHLSKNVSNNHFSQMITLIFLNYNAKTLDQTHKCIDLPLILVLALLNSVLIKIALKIL